MQTLENRINIHMNFGARTPDFKHLWAFGLFMSWAGHDIKFNLEFLFLWSQKISLNRAATAELEFQNRFPL